MTYFAIVTSFAIAIVGASKDIDCYNQTLINDAYYDKEIIKTFDDRPYLLAVDYSTNTLYFSYIINEKDDVSKTARIELNSNTFSDIDVPNGFAQTVDQENNDVYIGSNDGIYKYDHDTNEVEFIGQKGKDIWTIFFYKGVIYFSDFPSQFLYEIYNGTAIRFRDLEDTKVDHFLVDNEDTIFFSNLEGVYSQKKGTKDAVLIQQFNHAGPRGLATNKNGDVYICQRDGIYEVNKTASNAGKIVDVDCFGLAFDNENQIIYSEGNDLIRFKPSKNKCS